MIVGARRRPVERLRKCLRGWTYGQVKDLVASEGWELVDGRLHMRGPMSNWHRVVRETMAVAMRHARRAPYAVVPDPCLLISEFCSVRPDLVVVNQLDADLYETRTLPPESVVLAVDVVPEAGYSDLWFRKPELYAAAGIAYLWRVERGEDDQPILYEYWLDHESGDYLPAPAGPRSDLFSTTVPYPIRIDLHDIAAGQRG